MEREVTMFLLATPGSLTTSVTDYRVHAFKSRVEMHGYITAICLKVNLESAINELPWISQGVMTANGKFITWTTCSSEIY